MKLVDTRSKFVESVDRKAVDSTQVLAVSYIAVLRQRMGQNILGTIPRVLTDTARELGMIGVCRDLLHFEEPLKANTSPTLHRIGVEAVSPDDNASQSAPRKRRLLRSAFLSRCGRAGYREVCSIACVYASVFPLRLLTSRCSSQHLPDGAAVPHDVWMHCRGYMIGRLLQQVVNTMKMGKVFLLVGRNDPYDVLIYHGSY